MQLRRDVNALWSVGLAACLLTAMASSANNAQAEPTSLSVSAALHTKDGGPVSDGDYAIAIALYEAATGGQAVFVEKLAVKVTRGSFVAIVGVDDPAKKLDSGLFIAQKARFVGVSVGTDPELPRVALRPVPRSIASLSADTLACSGCVMGQHLATGSVASKHVQFVWAAGATKGGSAKHALSADAAKKADEATAAATAVKAQLATKAETATYADTAGNAKNAETAKNADAATTALTATSASALKCTGCVTADMVDATFAGDLVKASKLAAVAVSGKFADVSGPLAVDLDFNKRQAKLFRFENAAKDPAKCDATTVGLAYYDTTGQTLKVCNGKAFVVFAQASKLGSESQPALSCKAILADQSNAASGLYYLLLGGKSEAVYCEMKTAGGGWTLISMVSSSDANNWTHASGNWENASTFGSAAPDKDVDYKSAAFSQLAASEVRVDFGGKLLLRTSACLGNKSLSARFSGLGWTCGGSASLSSANACTNSCAVAQSVVIGGDSVLTEGKKVSHVFFKAGEANGVQDTNKDRAYLSTSARDGVDSPFGLGSFCSGSSCAIKGDIDMGVRNDGAKTPGAGFRYAIFVR